MATRVLIDTGYSFDPVGRTVVIPRAVPQERLISITNLTTGVIIYGTNPNQDGVNQAGSSVYTISGNTTTLTLRAGTGGMASTDKLQIVIDDPSVEISPAETQLDPVNKMRVSTPQALIDTDFEYGTQVTKWENLATINTRPFAYVTPSSVTITAITVPANSRVVTV